MLRSQTDATSVYQYFDDNGRLLYVGVTARGVKRMHEHAQSKSWWKHAASCRVQHYATRKSALLAEKFLIETLAPEYNIQHNGKSVPTHSAAQLDHEREEHAKHQVLSTVMGRLGRQKSLAEVDIDCLSAGLPLPVAEIVAREFRRAVAEDEALADFRAALRSALF